MIPDKLVEFIHGAVLAFVGTRDAQFRPAVTWAFGLRTSADTDEITAFVPDVEIAQTRSNLSQNGLIAVTVVHPISHECYQFKGKLAAMRPTTEEERAVQEIQRSKLGALLENLFPGVSAGFILAPSTAIAFKVEEAFVQTPGPGAGRPLDLSKEF
jgi:predicted pyridoxine 5'-phosphate oxidase superfamily flavin-nucleotide-binding protein